MTSSFCPHFVTSLCGPAVDTHSGWVWTLSESERRSLLVWAHNWPRKRSRVTRTTVGSRLHHGTFWSRFSRLTLTWESQSFAFHVTVHCWSICDGFHKFWKSPSLVSDKSDFELEWVGISIFWAVVQLFEFGFLWASWQCSGFLYPKLWNRYLSFVAISFAPICNRRSKNSLTCGSCCPFRVTIPVVDLDVNW